MIRWLPLLIATAALAAESGTVAGTVFDSDGLPAAGITVAFDDTSVVTDAGGSFVLTLAPGTWTAQINDSATDPFGVAPGQLSELLITLDGDRIARAIIEAPEPVVPVAEAVDVPIVTVAGQVLNEETGGPVADARVFVRGSDAEAVSDATGAFTLQLPEGSWRLSVVRGGFSAASPDVDATEGATVQVRLAPAAPELEEFVVLVPRIAGSDSALLDERKESSAVSDVLGAEQMARSGDSNAASALKRVSGLTVVGGKYVYVRGLGERYSATLLNGASLPSPEPERRVVPLDLFPTSMLDSVVIQKTFSPDMPGEFGGGVVRLRTKTVPEGPVASVGVTGAMTTGQTFTKSLRYAGGGTDWLGFDDGTRTLDADVQAASDEQPLEPRDLFSERGFTQDELEALGESMPNTWNLSRRTIAPDAGLALTLGYGKRWDSGREVGVLLGGGWSQAWDQQDITKNYYLVSEGGPELSHTYDFESLKRTISLGGILTAGGSPLPGQSFSSVTVVSRKSDDEARQYGGFNRDVAQPIEVSRLRWVERMLISQQVAGQHVIEPLSNLTIDWRWTGSWALRDEPDRREYRYDIEQDGSFALLSDRPEGNQRFFSGLRDEGHDVGWDVTLPFANWTGQEMRVKAGGVVLRKDREVDTRRFKFMHKGPRANDVEVRQGTPEDAFATDNIGADGFQFEETTRQTDNYLASHAINAAYVMAEIPIHARFELMAGVRVEDSTQQVTTFELFNPDAEPVTAELHTTDVLPAATATVRLGPDKAMAIRGGYGLTVSRPDFRELSPATFNDVTGGRQTFGNPDLQRALIHSVDVRWEWYPTSTESLSVGAFYKRFEGPIEKVVVPSAQLSVSWANSLASDSLGLELDGKKDFGFIHPALSDLWFAGNLTVIYSRVVLDPDAASTNTSANRPMEGQSPYVINASLGYDNPDVGTNVSLLYNVFGPRIAEVGALGLPDVREMPYHQLDLVLTQQLPGGLQIRFKAKNLINHLRRFRVGELEEQTMRPGAEFGLGLTWKPTALRKRADR